MSVLVDCAYYLYQSIDCVRSTHNMQIQRAALKRSVSCNDQLYPGKTARHLPTSPMVNKSSSNLHPGTCQAEHTEILRCRSEGSQSSNPPSPLTSMTRWMRGRASSAPDRCASEVNANSDGPQPDNLCNVNQRNAAEEVKRRWRSQQIAIQQKLAQAQRP